MQSKLNIMSAHRFNIWKSFTLAFIVFYIGSVIGTVIVLCLYSTKQNIRTELNNSTTDSNSSRTSCDCRLYDSHCSSDGCDLAISTDSICLYQDETDDYEWIKHSGSTPSSRTGPPSAKVGNFYHYLEASGMTRFEKVRLISEEIKKDNVTCLQFWYHMYGSDTGMLTIYRNNVSVWFKSGAQGDQWRQAQIVLTRSESPVQITFEATRGSGSYGDIAIDGVEIVQGGC